eukprot:scpid29988/ scgid20179/ Aplysianin-A
MVYMPGSSGAIATSMDCSGSTKRKRRRLGLASRAAAARRVEVNRFLTFCVWSFLFAGLLYVLVPRMCRYYSRRFYIPAGGYIIVSDDLHSGNSVTGAFGQIDVDKVVQGSRWSHSGIGGNHLPNQVEQEAQRRLQVAAAVDLPAFDPVVSNDDLVAYLHDLGAGEQAGGGAAYAGHTAPWDAVDNYVCSQECTSAYDVVIVGGGVSGLYAAWRLKQHDPDASVVVLEATGRTGGRLHSVPVPGMPNTRADVGGMHYVSRSDTMLNAWLVEKVFELKLRVFAQNSTDPRSFSFLRNTRITSDQLSDIDTIGKLYHLNDDEKKSFSSPLSMLAEMWARSVVNFTDPHLDMFSGRTTDGRRLHDMNLHDLHDMVGASSELRQFVEDSSGYGTWPDGKFNAASVLHMYREMLLGVQQSEHRVPALGMEALPDRLQQEFQNAHGNVQTNAPVSALAKCRKRQYFRYSVLVGAATREPVHHYCADKVILAVPPSALEKILWRPLHASTVWQRSVRAQPAFKLFLGFDRPWWREAPFGFYEGAEASTLDLERSYLLATEEAFSNRTDRADDNRNSLVLAAFATKHAVRWASLQADDVDRQSFRGLPNRHVKQNSSTVPGSTDFTVSQKMVELAMEQLRTLHGDQTGHTIPQPYTAVAKSWDAACHGWLPGVNPAKVLQEIGQLDPHQNVYICGEAYSKIQGWVEGSLRSTEYLLRHHLNVPSLPGMPSEWLKRYAP